MAFAPARHSLIIRTFCTKAEKMIKPPIQQFGLEGRYATALFSAATKMKQLDAVEKDLLKIQSSMKTDTKFKEFMINPTLKRSVKIGAVEHLSKKISLSPATGNLLQLLAENGRLNKLDSVINSFKIIMAANRGEVVCEVTTAKPLDESQRKNLDAALKKFLKNNETIQLTIKTNPAIIGGMIVSIGDRYVDMSVASKIKRYTEIIQAAA